MELLMLVAADYASVDQATGKLNILGAFRSIFAAEFPAQHRAMSVVVKLGGELGDNQEQHILAVALTDEDGNEMFRASGPFNLPRLSAGVQPEHNVILELRNLVFPHAGSYRIHVDVDDDEKGSTDITLAQIPSPQE